MRDTSSPQPDFVFILGMHRSGTSCLAGSLHGCGLNLGKVRRQSSDSANPKGYFEFGRPKHLNQQILTMSGGSWQNPPQELRINLLQRQVIRASVDYLSIVKPCGFKDPRLLLVMQPWLEIVKSPAFVATFRHPTAVARSLARRNQMSPDEAYGLWLHYNMKLVNLHQQHRFPLVEFDLSDTDRYLATIAVAALQFGLHPNRQVREFVSAELDRSQTSDQTIPAECQPCYDYLMAHRIQPDKSQELLRLFDSDPPEQWQVLQSHEESNRQSLTQRWLMLRLRTWMVLSYRWARVLGYTTHV